MGDPMHSREMTGQSPRVVGRYALCDAIAAGGMATVHIGRLLGPVGFSRTVAIKRLHEQFAQSDEFVAMFLDEARLVARIRHPNVVPTLDIVATTAPMAELFLVMEYVPGESLAKMLRGATEQGWRVPPRIVATILAASLHGLHAAHEASDEQGQPLGIVHRDVSPQNILVGTDGVTRILDFGVAKAAGRVQTTQAGQIKGKLAYMAPEQVRSDTVSRQTDIYAASICLWEGITGQRLYTGSSDGAVLAKVLEANVQPPSAVAQQHKIRLDDEAMQDVLRLDGIVMRGLARDPAYRFQTAREMALLIEQSIRPATGAEIATWVEAAARKALGERAQLISKIERDDSLQRLVPGGNDGGSNGNVQMIASRSSQPDVSSAVSSLSRANASAGGSGILPVPGASHSMIPGGMSVSPAQGQGQGTISSPYALSGNGPANGGANANNAGVISSVSQVSQVSQASAGAHISGLSQLSGIAMTSSQAPPASAPAKASRTPLYIAASATVFGIGLAIVIASVLRAAHSASLAKEMQQQQPTIAVASPGTGSAAAVPQPQPQLQPPASASAPSPASSASSLAPAGSVVLDSPDSSAHPAGAASSNAPAPTASAAPPEHHHHDPCSPPYTTDASGIRHYKPQCI